MSRGSIALGIVALITLAGFIGSPTGNAQPRGGGAGGALEDPFAGKYLTIVKRSNPASSIDLEKVELRKLDTRSFLVGTGSDTPDNWQKGRTVWVALDDVSEVTVFATLEELRKASQSPDAPKPEGPPKKEGQ